MTTTINTDLLTPLGASGPEGTPVGFRLNIRYLAPGLALALVLAAIPPPIGRRDLWRLGALGLFGGLTLAIREVIACFPVYRTYIRPDAERASETDRRYIEEAVSKAKMRTPR